MSDTEHESELDETVDLKGAQTIASKLDPSRAEGAANGGMRSRSARFLLGKQLGSGGMAVVYEAQDTDLERTVAVKTLRAELGEHDEACGRFFAEARIMGALDHPGVIPVFEAGELADGKSFYAMKKVHGITLKDALALRPDKEVASRSVMMHFVDHFERVCQAVAAAHAKGIIHRDLKPANVMIDELEQVLVLDWGIAKRLERDEGVDDSRTRAGAVMGTPAYMSPEQASGHTADSDCQSDVFSLGAMLYEILTGVQPFAAIDGRQAMKGVMYHNPEPPMKRNPQVGRELSAVCMKALAKDPFERYPSARELAEDLRRFREFRPVSAIAPRAVDRLGKWLLRHRTLAAVLGTVLLAVLVVGFGAALQAGVERQMVGAAYERIDRAEAEIEQVQAQIVHLRGQIAAAANEQAREALEDLLLDLEAGLEAHREAVVSMATAITGFTIFSPEERARQILRDNTLREIDFLVQSGQVAQARVRLAYALAVAEKRNPLGFAAEDITWMRTTAAEIEVIHDGRPIG